MLNAYRPSKGLTKAVTFFLGANAFLALVAAGSSFMDVEMLGRFEQTEEIPMGEFLAAGVRALAIAVPTFVVWVTTVVLFCMWIVRASKNARALGAQGMQITPGWAAGWFFIPLANLVMPFKAVSEIWKASEPEAATDPVAWKGAAATPVVVWWSFWILSGVIGGLNFQLGSPESISSLKSAAYISLFGSVLSMFCAFAAVAVVRGIHFRQEAKHELYATGAVPFPVGNAPMEVGGSPFLRQAPAA